MSEQVERAGLQVDAALAAFVEGEVLAPLGRDVDAFWAGFAALCERFVPRNRALLAKRDGLQAQIDAWHLRSRRASRSIQADYQAFLREIGYLVPEPAPFRIGTAERRPRDRDHGRAAAGGAGAQRAVPAQCRQRALGQPLRCLLRHRCARCRRRPSPVATTRCAGPR